MRDISSGRDFEQYIDARCHSATADGLCATREQLLLFLLKLSLSKGPYAHPYQADSLGRRVLVTICFSICLFCDYCNDLLRIQWLIIEACLVKLYPGRCSRPPPVERPPHFLALSEKHLHWGPFNWSLPDRAIPKASRSLGCGSGDCFHGSRFLDLGR